MGELLLLDQDFKLLWKENHTASIERYNHYCADNGITAQHPTSWTA